MSIGSFLFGSSGGVPKDVKRRLYSAYNQYADENVPADELAFIRQSVEPTYQRARTNLASEYANADAPIVSGGRTQGLIGLAGEEAGNIGQLTQEAKDRRRQLKMQYLQMLMQGTYKQPTSGLVGSLAGGVGAYLGAK